MTSKILLTSGSLQPEFSFSNSLQNLYVQPDLKKYKSLIPANTVSCTFIILLEFMKGLFKVSAIYDRISSGLFPYFFSHISESLLPPLNSIVCS